MTGASALRMVYTLAQVAEMLGVSVRTVRRWVAAGNFPKPMLLPGPWRFRRAEVEQFISTGKLPE